MTAAGGVALAQEKSSAIAVIDVRFVMQNADAAKNVRAQIEKARAELQEKAKGEEEALDKLTQSIAQQRPTLVADVYEQLLRGLREKVANHEIDMQERQDKLDRASLEASKKVAGAIVQIVDEIVKEQNFAFVLNRSAVISTTVDITQEVLKRLNQQMPSITIDLPK